MPRDRDGHDHSLEPDALTHDPVARIPHGARGRIRISNRQDARVANTLASLATRRLASWIRLGGGDLLVPVEGVSIEVRLHGSRTRPLLDAFHGNRETVPERHLLAARLATLERLEGRGHDDLMLDDR